MPLNNYSLVTKSNGIICIGRSQSYITGDGKAFANLISIYTITPSCKCSTAFCKEIRCWTFISRAILRIFCCWNYTRCFTFTTGNGR